MVTLDKTYWVDNETEIIETVEHYQFVTTNELKQFSNTLHYLPYTHKD